MLIVVSRRAMRRWRPLAGLFCWLCLVGAALAQPLDRIVERGWLEDPSGQLTWSDVPQLDARPFGEVLNQGYGPAVLWLRLRIDPAVGRPDSTASAAIDPDRLVLRMRPAYLDEVTVYDPLVPGGIAGVVGDRHHPRQDVMPGTDFLLPIARGNEPRDIWLRLSTTSTRQIHAAVMHPRDLAAATMRQNIVVSLYIGLVLVLLVWGLVHWLLYRESVMGAYALMQLTAGLFGLSSLGVLRVFWPDAWDAEWLDLSGSVFAVVVVVAGLGFHVRFLREFRPAAWAMGSLRALLGLSVFNLVLLAMGEVSLPLEINLVIILLAPLVCLFCAMTGRAWATADSGSAPALSRCALVAFYLVFLVIFLLAATTGLGLVPATAWTLYISQLHGLVSSVLLMLMLQYRSYIQNRQRQEALLTLETTSLQAAHERQLREENEKLLTMLAHEIKTPLATMHLRLDGQARGGREIREAMRDMNDVIERCLQTLQLGDGRLTPQRHRVDLADLVRNALPAWSNAEQVRIDLPPSLTTETDPQLFFIVLSNLLENACKYAKAETPIELVGRRMATPPSGEALRLVVSNLPGKAGWPDARRVFDRYYRAPQAQRQSGTGLGLYLAQSLMQTLGGELSYEPDGEKVRFVVTLPLVACA